MNRRCTRVLSVLAILSLSISVFAFSAADTYASSAYITMPKYIAHRGWNTRAPENTPAAFRLAAKEKGFYGVEFDIWESRAEKSAEPLLLVMHDENISRMCGVSKSVRDIDRSTLGKYTIINGNNISKYSGQTVPTVNEALDSIWSTRKNAVPIIELKHRLSGKALRYLFDLIGNHKAEIISFDYSAVKDAEKLAKKRGVSSRVRTMYLVKNLASKNYKPLARKLRRDSIDCISLRYAIVTKATVKAFHKQGLKVSVWSLPDKATARKFIRMGVDYITSDGRLF